MTTAREVMSGSPTIVDAATTVDTIARTLRDEGIGAVVVCNADKRLQGVVTDRDIVVEVLAAGRDVTSTSAADILSGRETVTIGADDGLDEAVQTMSQHAVRRLPVIDGDRVVGMLSQADIARHADDAQVATLVRTISELGDNSGQG
jgi:CBS domain-containing protein